MRRFHLHLWEGGNCVLDEEGIDLPDRDAAIALARCTLGESLADDLEAGRMPLNRCIVIADSRGQLLGRLSTSKLLAFNTNNPAWEAEFELT